MLDGHDYRSLETTDLRPQATVDSRGELAKIEGTWVLKLNG